MDAYISKILSQADGQRKDRDGKEYPQTCSLIQSQKSLFSVCHCQTMEDIAISIESPFQLPSLSCLIRSLDLHAQFHHLEGRGNEAWNCSCSSWAEDALSQWWFRLVNYKVLLEFLEAGKENSACWTKEYQGCSESLHTLKVTLYNPIIP